MTRQKFVFRLVVSTLTLYTVTPSHVSPEVFTFTYPLADVCQRFGPVVLHDLCNHGKNLSESFVIHYCKIHGLLLTTLPKLKMRFSAAADTHKSWLNPQPLSSTQLWRPLWCWENLIWTPSLCLLEPCFGGRRVPSKTDPFCFWGTQGDSKTI